MFENWGWKKKVGVGVLGIFIFLLALGVLLPSQKDKSRPGNIRVTNLTLSSKEGNIGENVTVTVKIKNTSGKRATENLKLRIDDESRKKSITLGPGESKSVKFQISKKELGSHTVEISRFTDSFEIVEPKSSPKLFVENLEVFNEKARPNEPVKIVIAAKNTGGDAGTFVLDLSISGKIVENQKIVLNPGEIRKVKFTVKRENVGVYTFEIGDLSGEFSVRRIDKNIVTVIEVVDGDTIEVKFPNGRENIVRMLGVDTPETHRDVHPEEFEGIENAEHLEKWGLKAKDFARKILLYKEVRLRFDSVAGKVGYFGRMLAYVIIDNTNFNLELVREGYARAYTDANCQLLENFIALEKSARENEVGLWDVPENKGGDNEMVECENVYISLVHEDAPGNDHENPNGEYIKITNRATTEVDMSGWSLSDVADHIYYFPEGFVLQPEATVTVYTGSGEDSSTELYWGSDSAIWNNSGDIAYLKNSQGDLIDKTSWGD